MGGLKGAGCGLKRQRSHRARADARTDVLPAGVVVRLVGLSSTSLNGSVGHVSEYDEVKQRYVVSLADGASIAVKPTNVRQVLSDARVVGTSKAELNGKVAASATFDESSGRYQCEGLQPDGRVLSLKPENLVLPAECRVVIGGVSSRPELNGRIGRIATVSNERYVVQLAGDMAGESVSLRLGAVTAC